MMVWKPVVVNPPLQDSFTCDGSIRLSAYMQYAGAYDFQWTPAVFLEQSDTAIAKGNINQTTTFVVTAKDQVSGCMGSDTVTIEKYPLPAITVNNDTTILAGGAAPLQATGGNVYLWAPSYWLDNERIPNPVARPQQPVTYTVKVTNEYGCSDSDSVHINIIEGVQLPNAFSPNGDGINDEFRLVNYGYEKIIHFVIYDRWGKQVFIADHNTKGWNGTINGKPAEVGTYYYNIRLQLMNGTEKLFRGSVILIR